MAYGDITYKTKVDGDEFEVTIITEGGINPRHDRKYKYPDQTDEISIFERGPDLKFNPGGFDLSIYSDDPASRKTAQIDRDSAYALHTWLSERLYG